MFAESGENLVVGAGLLKEMLGADLIERKDVADRMRSAEHAGDEATHAIMRELNETFVTPFDREDIYRLASALDDVVDDMEEAAARIVLYRLKALPAGVAEQVEVLRRAAACTAAAMPKLERLADLESYWIDVNSLEDHADAIYRRLLGELLAPVDRAAPEDLLTALTTKEVVEILEDAADAFETVANTVHSIAVKEA
jgi:predicted phosphate transport protein (TIGR00153 family)